MKILMEISGGADSMLSSLLAIKKYGPDAEYHGILVDYHQLPFEKEKAKALEFCDKYNIKLHIVSVDGLFVGGAVTGEHNVEEVSDIYTPLRNFVIGAMASSLAERIGASVIVSGSKTLNKDKQPWSFSDSTLGFYLHMDSMLNYLTDGSIKMDPILMENRQNKMTKFEVFDALIDDFGLNMSDFWNCFNSSTTQCGECNNCKEIQKYNERTK
jgi:7-cyano-7-deazaguanine synthase in queuosine biosynthesis